MTTKKKDAATENAEQPKKKGMFAKFKEVDKATSSADLNNFEIQLGDNKCRIISDPIMVLKHWDLPASSEMTVVPCLKHVTDLDAYSDDPEGYLATLPDCPFCDFHAEHEDFYTLRQSWVFNVVQDGIVKVAEFAQKSVLRALYEFENSEDWAPLMPNGLEDLEINIKKVSTGPKPQNVKYEVGGVPTSKPLDAEQLAEYRSNMIDVAKLKAPPSPDTEEGKTKIAELLTKAQKPKEGEKPKAPGK